MTPLTFN